MDSLNGPSIFGIVVPDHVVALETAKLGNRYHAFLLISEREKWIAEDPEHRKTVYAREQKVLEAWKSFSIVLHADPKALRALWR